MNMRGRGPWSFLSLVVPKRRSFWLVLVIFLPATTGMARVMPQAPSRSDSQPGAPLSSRAPLQNPALEQTPVVLPAGTRLALILTHPVDSGTTHRGDEIYAQTTAPVIVNSRVVIPPGTFLQGKVEKLTRHGTRAEFLMQSASVVFPDGFVLSISGPMNIKSGEGTAWADPGAGTKAGMIAAPLVGGGLGTAIGAAAHTTRTINFGGTPMTTRSLNGVAIGSAVGLAAGVVVSLVLLARNHHFYMETGSALEMILPQAVTVAQEQIVDRGGEQGR